MYLIIYFFFGFLKNRIFRNMDDDGSKALNEYEFTKGIKEMGLELKNDEIKEMFRR